MVKLSNVSEKAVTWALDMSGQQRVEDGTFKFVLASGAFFVPPAAKCSRPSTTQPGEIGHLDPGKKFKFGVLCSPSEYVRIQ